jgi:hypothetical protein
MPLPAEFEMAKQLVEVIDRHGHVVYSTMVALEHDDCIDAEFEEVALVFAENHGLVPKEEHIPFRARCVR